MGLESNGDTPLRAPPARVHWNHRSNLVES
uniref:Uncharacterized protein n=1 Tax=Arundo donax TaxID=35708 RepID=A0A0A8ZU32_ARUDO